MSAERMPHDESLLTQPLKWLTELTLRAPATVLWMAGILTLVSIVIAASGLKFKTSRLDLLNPESRYNKRWLAYLDEFGDRDDAVVVVRAADPAAVKGAIEDVARELSNHPRYFESILWQPDLSRLKAKGLHQAPTPELERLAAELDQAVHARDTAAQARPAAALAALNDRWIRAQPVAANQRRAFEREYEQVAGRLLSMASDTGGARLQNAGSEPLADPNSTAGIRKLLAALNRFDAGQPTSDNGRMGFILLRLANSKNEFARGGEAIGKLRQIIDEARPRNPDVVLGLTGMPVIEYDEMRISQWDMLWTNIVSLVGCLLLFVAGYGGMRHAGMATAVLVMGMAWSFAFVTLAVGHLNILSSAFAIVLIGLGIDFGIHYVASYLRLRGIGLDARAALVRTAAEVGPGVVTSGVTTAAAFFMAAVTQFVGVRELGIIAGGGILLCVAAAIVVLPPMILAFDRERALVRMPSLLPVAQSLSWLHRRPGMVLSVAAIATALSFAGVMRLKYDHNLLHLQPSHVESVEIEQEVFAHQEDSVWFAVSICNSREELKRRKSIFDRLASVAKTEEIATLIPDADGKRNEVIANIHQSLVLLFEEPAASDDAPSASAAVDPAAEAASLRDELRRGAQLLAGDMPPERGTQAMLLEAASRLGALSPQQAAGAFQAGAQQNLAALRRGIAPLAPLLEISDPEPPTAADLPRELADRYIGRTGKHLLKVYARGDIWDMDRLKRFVADVESIDPQVTGHPVQTYYASRHLQLSYVQAGIFALLAVFALILFDFRSIRHSLLAMVPLGMGFLQMCGLIGWFGIPLNAANLIALPLILGIGVDDGVHLVHDLRRHGGRFRLTDSTAVAVILISTTTMASFGALILARHQGLRSLGQVLTLGTFLCLTCSMLVFPALLTWLTRHLPELPEESSTPELELGGAAAAPVEKPAHENEADLAVSGSSEPAKWTIVSPPLETAEVIGNPSRQQQAGEPSERPRRVVPRRRAG